MITKPPVKLLIISNLQILQRSTMCSFVLRCTKDMIQSMSMRGMRIRALGDFSYMNAYMSQPQASVGHVRSLGGKEL